MAINTTSSLNTPQAGDDTYSTTENYLTGGNVLVLDVMSNDLGGKAKTLWSIDDGYGNPMDPANLLSSDIGDEWESTSHGNQIRIIDGHIEYKLGNSTDVNALGAGEVMHDTFTYAIRLANGTLSLATVHVDIVGDNDAPTISAADSSGAVTEDLAIVADDPNTAGTEVGSYLTDTGTITFDDVDLTDTHSTSVIPAVDNTLDGKLTAVVTDPATGTTDGTVTWIYSVANSATQYLGVGDTATETFTIRINDNHGGFVDQVVTFTITGTNDQPTVSAHTDGSITEDASPVSLATSGTITFDDADLTDLHSVSVTPTSNPLGGVLTADVADTATVGDGVVTWNYSVANSATQYLAAGETAIETFTVSIEDDSGTGNDTVTQLITVTITGTNDRPDITVNAGASDAASASLTESDVPLTASDTLTATDVDVTDLIGVSVESVSTSGPTGGLSNATLLAMMGVAPTPVDTIATTSGQFTWTFNSTPQAFNFLNTTDTLQLTYTIKADDSHTGTDTQLVTITIQGTNDAAVITGTSSGTVVEAGGSLAIPVAGTPTATGDLLSTDVDNTTDAFQAVGSATGSANGYGTYTVDAAGVWTYTLDNTNGTVQALNSTGVNTTLSDSFTVLSQDGTAKVVNITINGTNDAAVVTGTSSGTVVEATAANGGGTPTATGDLLATDVDNANDAFQAAATASANGYGTYTVDAAGVWNYTLDNSNAAVNALNNGQFLTDSFTVLSQDGTSQVVNITINGATDIVNQAPADISLNISAAGGGNSLPGAGTIGTFSTTDPDVGDTFVYSLLAGSSSGFTVSGSGTLIATSNLIENTTYILNIQTQDQGGTGLAYQETFNIITGTNQGGGNTGDETLPSGGSGSGILVGDDVLYGGGGNDFIFGGSGNDSIFGQNGNDTLVGGIGNDTLSGSSQSDTYRWNLSDQGTILSPAIDTVMDFATSGNKDVLNLQDLLQGESHTGSLAGNLANFLHFSTSGGNTTIEVSTTGAFGSQAVGGAVGGGDQTIQLTGVNLVGASATQDAIIQNLFTNGLLTTN